MVENRVVDIGDRHAGHRTAVVALRDRLAGT
jgi:hypothetical protein